MADAQAQIVDVVIAAWNRADTIERAISSALAEPEVRQVIVVDDASMDDSADRARRLGGDTGRVMVVSLPVNVGPAAARNRALALSTAPWITILDGDDFVLPGRLRRLLASSQDWDFVADDILQVPSSEIGTREPRPTMFEREFEPWRLDFSTFVLGNCGRRGYSHAELGYFKPLIRRSFLNVARVRYDERLRLGEDYAFYANALARGARVLVMPACGYVSVRRPNSLSARHTRQDLERLRDADLELARIETLSDSDRRALAQHGRSIDGRIQWLKTIEAFKSRSLKGFVSPFLRSPETSVFLARKLVEEISRRSEAWLGHQWR